MGLNIDMPVAPTKVDRTVGRCGPVASNVPAAKPKTPTEKSADEVLRIGVFVVPIWLPPSETGSMLHISVLLVGSCRKLSRPVVSGKPLIAALRRDLDRCIFPVARLRHVLLVALLQSCD
jgi:hypothetical protein